MSAARAIRVLCVDDNPDLSLLLDRRISLETDMRSIGRVHDLDRLLDEAQEARPDVVVLDLSMMGRDSLEVMRTLQARCPGARTLIYSGYDHRDAVQRARDAGAWGFVTKGCGEDNLPQVIRRIAGGQRVFPQP